MHNALSNRHTCHFFSVCDDTTERYPDANSAFANDAPSFAKKADSKITVIYFSNYTKHMFYTLWVKFKVSERARAKLNPFNV